MKKNDIVDYVINNTTLSRSQAIAATESVVEAISSSLVKGESVFIRGFATIKAVTTAPKKARNISKGTVVSIPAQNTAKLVLSKELKNRMNLKEIVMKNNFTRALNSRFVPIIFRKIIGNFFNWKFYICSLTCRKQVPTNTFKNRNTFKKAIIFFCKFRKT